MSCSLMLGLEVELAGRMALLQSPLWRHTQYPVLQAYWNMESLMNMSPLESEVSVAQTQRLSAPDERFRHF